MANYAKLYYINYGICDGKAANHELRVNASHRKCLGFRDNGHGFLITNCSRECAKLQEGPPCPMLRAQK